MMKKNFKCKECEETEKFKDNEDAKENDWHKTGNKWICEECWEDEYDDDEDDDDEDDDDSFSGSDSSSSFGGGSFGGGGSNF